MPWFIELFFAIATILLLAFLGSLPFPRLREFFFHQIDCVIHRLAPPVSNPPAQVAQADWKDPEGTAWDEAFFQETGFTVHQAAVLASCMECGGLRCTLEPFHRGDQAREYVRCPDCRAFYHMSWVKPGPRAALRLMEEQPGLYFTVGEYMKAGARIAAEKQG